MLFVGTPLNTHFHQLPFIQFSFDKQMNNTEIVDFYKKIMWKLYKVNGWYLVWYCLLYIQWNCVLWFGFEIVIFVISFCYRYVLYPALVIEYLFDCVPPVTVWFFKPIRCRIKGQ